jgi:cytochrome c oxidase subunit 2
MDHRERKWLFLLVGVFLLFNVVTLSPLIPWQKWLLWSSPEPDRRVSLEYADYQIEMPPEGIEAHVGEYIEFVAVSKDVTYGFGVFRQDGTMVFQMQVPPGRQNSILWKFSEPGLYDVRSTEYSGPRHSGMYYPDAIRVTQ